MDVHADALGNYLSHTVVLHINSETTLKKWSVVG